METLGLPWHVPAPLLQDDSDDQHTPPWLLERVALLWPGGIGTDPAWSPECKVVAALTYDGRAADRDGLTQPWRGCVWCNPPYSDVGPWARRLATYHAATQEEVLLLVNVSVSTQWFRSVCPDSSHPGAARAVAFFSKRIAFIKGGVERRGNDREQMMLWWGASRRLRAFRKSFSGVAWIAT